MYVITHVTSHEYLKYCTTPIPIFLGVRLVVRGFAYAYTPADVMIILLLLTKSLYVDQLKGIL